MKKRDLLKQKKKETYERDGRLDQIAPKKETWQTPTRVLQEEKDQINEGVRNPWTQELYD